MATCWQIPAASALGAWCVLEARQRASPNKDCLPGILKRLPGPHRAKEHEAQLIVSTAHKAKGREFETVVVLEDFELPKDLVARRIRDKTKTDETDQLINLLYVACTRATKRLILADKLFGGLR
jgi:ATP-dependent exoDNAse (exonuclease V) beta subunit